jgi:hypothetical protein
MKKFTGIMIALIVLGITTLLLFQIPKDHNPQGRTANDQGAASGADEEWMGIFIQGQRVGYSFTRVVRSDSGLEIENKNQMTIFMMQQIASIATHFFAHTNSDYTLKDFSLDIAAPGHPVKVEGKIEGTTLTLTSYSQGIEQKQTKQLKEKPFFPDALEEVVKAKGLKTGDELTIPYFDPTTQSTASAKIKIHGSETVQVLGRESSGTKVEVNFMGMISYMWLDQEYRVLKESTPSLGMEMVPLSKGEALAEIKPTEAIDLLSFFSVKIDRTVPAGHEVSSVKLELKNIETEDLDLSDDYQRCQSQEPLIIEIVLARPDDLPDLEIPITGQDEFLAPSVYVQCDHPEIAAAARRIIGSEKNAADAVRRLVHGVYSMLAKVPTPSLPSALDVLKTKEGDCNEHSVLFAALARAAGIPTKIYVGLVNLYGNAYFYHAWCAVWLGKWVPVDPTFDQFPADVRHLKLKEGEISDWAQVLKVVGRLEIEVIDYK